MDKGFAEIFYFEYKNVIFSIIVQTEKDERRFSFYEKIKEAAASDNDCLRACGFRGSRKHRCLSDRCRDSHQHVHGRQNFKTYFLKSLHFGNFKNSVLKWVTKME